MIRRIWTFPQRWGVRTTCQKGFLILCHVHEVSHLVWTSSDTIKSENSLKSNYWWWVKLIAKHKKVLTTASRFHSPQSLGMFTFVDTLKEKKVHMKSMKPGSSCMVGCFWPFPPKAPSSRQRRAVKGPSKIQRAWKENEDDIKKDIFHTLTRPCRVCSCTDSLFPSPKNQGWQTHFG